ncbi:UNVERIFIED_CONTAM: hypothetical protein GTU68_008825 [Idotea baltica]|nr:hypothetical protein [Idotea baltica]
MKMHYVDEGAGEVVLCLHGEPSWSYLYRKFVPKLSAQHRIICPDFFGFGKSDKPTNISDYSFQFHFDSLIHFIETLDLQNISLVVQDWGGLLGLSAVAHFPERFARLIIMNTFLPIGKRKLPITFKAWQLFARYFPKLPIGQIMQFGTHQKLDKNVVAAYNAPFPNTQHKAGAKSFPILVPSGPNDPSIPFLTAARENLKKWHKPALVMFSDKDPIMWGAQKWFCYNIPSTNLDEFIRIKDAGHFLQEEKGEEITGHILKFMKKHPLSYSH